MQWNKILVGAVIAVVAALGYLVFGGNGDDGIPEGIAYGNGRIEAVQVDISTRIPGRVKEVLAKEGDLVKPGQKVAIIDSAQLRAQLLRAKADIASAKSQVAAAKASVEQVKAQLILREQELNRTRALVKKGHSSREKYDTRVSEHKVTQANLAAAKATLVSRERSVDAARAGAEEIETQIADCTLVSPTLGRVLYRLAEPGEVLGSGGRVLTLVNLSNIYMEIFLPSAKAHRVSIGSEARVKLDIFDFVAPAKVTFVSPQSQFTPKQVETQSEREKLMFRVKVRVPEELVREHIEKVKTGMRGVAYVRLAGGPKPEWPAFLEKNLPKSTKPAAATNSK
jgi:HlyD family secretion protein